MMHDPYKISSYRETKRNWIVIILLLTILKFGCGLNVDLTKVIAKGHITIFYESTEIFVAQYELVATY